MMKMNPFEFAFYLLVSGSLFLGFAIVMVRENPGWMQPAQAAEYVDTELYLCIPLESEDTPMLLTAAEIHGDRPMMMGTDIHGDRVIAPRKLSWFCVNAEDAK